MPNSNYIKGVRKERKIVNFSRQAGLISFRSAGSHSPIDVVIIDKKDKEIQFIQCKPDSMSDNAHKKLLDEQIELNGTYTVYFKVC